MPTPNHNIVNRTADADRRRIALPLIGALQGAPRSRGDELAVFVFDLLRRDEDDLTEVPLSQRKQLLMRLVGHDFPCLHPADAFEDGAKLLEVAERHGLEGIVSTRKARAYRSGPSRDWSRSKRRPGGW